MPQAPGRPTTGTSPLGALRDSAIAAARGLAAADLDNAELMEAVTTIEHTLAAVLALEARALAELDRRGCTEATHGLSTQGWMRDVFGEATHVARSRIRTARLLDEQAAPAWEALAAGAVCWSQSQVIAEAVERLPEDLSPGLRSEVAHVLVGEAEAFDARQLRRISNEAVALVAPDVVDEADRLALERQERRAAATMSFTSGFDGHGSWFFRGKLPAHEGEHVAAVIDALALRPHTDIAHEETDPLLPYSVRRAQALVELAAAYSTEGRAPVSGGDRPRILVMTTWETLRTGKGRATLGSGEPISPDTARMLACDADIVPAVMGADSVPLDIGREKRLFAREIRAALMLRDRGCAFPGCDRPIRDCEAHHIVPWWAGGTTAVANGVLLCRHHHRLVEPSRDSERSPEQRWQVRLDSRGLPEFCAPPPVNPERRWRQQPRFLPRRGSGKDPDPDLVRAA